MKWLFVILIIGAIVYTFRDTAGPILEQLKETTPSVLAGICVMSGIYCLVEALITTVLAKQYNPDFRYQWGIENMFFCSFYRVATLGSMLFITGSNQVLIPPMSAYRLLYVG